MDWPGEKPSMRQGINHCKSVPEQHFGGNGCWQLLSILLVNIYLNSTPEDLIDKMLSFSEACLGLLEGGGAPVWKGNFHWLV